MRAMLWYFANPNLNKAQIALVQTDRILFLVGTRYFAGKQLAWNGGEKADDTPDIIIQVLHSPTLIYIA
jgi:hypothetical protein